MLLLWSCQNSGEIQNTNDPYSAKVDSMLNEMTLEEKIGQMTLYTSGWTVTGPTLNDNYKEELRAGKVGGLFNAHTVEYARNLQRIAVEETRLGIPLLFGYDVIHGYKTIFPIPLAEASSWDMKLIEKTARLSAKEATAGGLNWTFNPMVDIARDPRWGRIAEGAGEDPYLGSLIGAAKVKGYQGSDLKDPSTMVACVKHMAAYGAPQAGRDYHTVDMSERVLREVYLPPYKAAIDAGVGTVMSSFNEVDGVPATGSHFLLTEILREEWGFEGFVVTDYTSINEMVPHGIVANEKEAAKLALDAGVDMDMQGSVFNNHLKELTEEGGIDELQIDQAVRRILTMKYRLGLFDNPYRYLDAEREKEILFSDELMDHALEVARESIVLLKNEKFNETKILPLKKDTRTIAVIGPLGDNKIDMLGTWHASGDESKVVTLLQGIKSVVPDATVNYAQGCDFTTEDKSGFSEALRTARAADVVIMAVGENYQQSGEAASRSIIDLPGVQQELMEEVHKLGKPMVAVVMAGRPLTISWMDDNIPAILNAWHLGTMSGKAIAEILFGADNPSGKLTITFPRNVGQIPIFYSVKNTGRPFDAENKYTSKYLDIPNTPLYPFGYGLSYTEFTYSDISINQETISKGDTLEATVTITNTGDYDGEEIVQLYTRDLVGSVTRPMKELKGYRKIALPKGASESVTFELTVNDLAFYRKDMTFGYEPGEFTLFIGRDSDDVQSVNFRVN